MGAVLDVTICPLDHQAQLQKFERNGQHNPLRVEDQSLSPCSGPNGPRSRPSNEEVSHLVGPQAESDDSLIKTRVAAVTAQAHLQELAGIHPPAHHTATERSPAHNGTVLCQFNPPP
jgi:hypothetical protein